MKEQIQNKMGGLSFVNITAAADKHKGNIASKTALKELETSARANATAPGKSKTSNSPIENNSIIS